jgi:hypothetical protein
MFIKDKIRTIFSILILPWPFYRALTHLANWIHPGILVRGSLSEVPKDVYAISQVRFRKLSQPSSLILHIYSVCPPICFHVCIWAIFWGTKGFCLSVCLCAHRGLSVCTGIRKLSLKVQNTVNCKMHKPLHRHFNCSHWNISMLTNVFPEERAHHSGSNSL